MVFAQKNTSANIQEYLFICKFFAKFNIFGGGGCY